MLGVVRQHSWDLAVFVHVLGAMTLVGGLVTAAAAGIIGWRDSGGALRRLSALTLFAVAFPGWIVMRAGAQWAYSTEGWDKVPSKFQPTLGIGYFTADIGGIILLIALVLGGSASAGTAPAAERGSSGRARRLRRS